MSEFTKNLVMVMKQSQEPYDLSDEELFEIADMLAVTFERLFKGVTEAEMSQIFDLISLRYARLGENIFRDINPSNVDNENFREELEKRVKLTTDGKSIHLELGSYIRWSEERTEDYVRKENIGDVIRLDMNPEFDLDVAASVTAMPFADESIDRIYSNSLFEHVPYPHEIIREAYRVLRPGGFMLTSVPFHFVEHGCPGDFLRFTGAFFQQVGADAGFVDIVTDTSSTSGVYYTTHQLLKAGVAMERDVNPFCASAQMMHIYSLMLLAGAQAVDTLFHAHGASCWHTTYALMSKPGPYKNRTCAPDRSKPFLERFSDLICPSSGLPLNRVGDTLVSLDGANSYPIVDGKPNLFVMHGFNSGFTQRGSSIERLASFQADFH